MLWFVVVQIVSWIDACAGQLFIYIRFASSLIWKIIIFQILNILLFLFRLSADLARQLFVDIFNHL